MNTRDHTFQHSHTQSIRDFLTPVVCALALFLLPPYTETAYPAPIEGTDEGASVMMDDWVKMYDANALADAYGGDSTLNHGYKRTPILFDNCDESGSNCRRKYPKLRNDTGGLTNDVPDLRNIISDGEFSSPDPRSQIQSLSTDDEITRAT
ncbi:MAG: hypothetical protein KDD66_17700, partial [Bdellovibrionales bacterium]|nr:hypothetical protein [Bdellovibrionales bacterium]